MFAGKELCADDVDIFFVSRWIEPTIGDEQQQIARKFDTIALAIQSKNLA